MNDPWAWGLAFLLGVTMVAKPHRIAPLHQQAPGTTPKATAPANTPSPRIRVPFSRNLHHRGSGGAKTGSPLLF